MNRLSFTVLWLFVLFIPLESSVVIPGIGSVSRFIGLFAFAAVIVDVVISGKVRTWQGSIVLMTAIVGWSALSFLWNKFPDTSIIDIRMDMQLLILAVLIWQIAPDRDRQISLMQALVFGAFVSAIFTIRGFFLGIAYSVSLYQRFSALGFDPNSLALVLVLCIPIAWYLSAQKSGSKMGWLNLLYVPVAILAIILTASRGAFIALCFALLIIPLSFTGPTEDALAAGFSRGQKIMIALTVAMSIYAVVTFVPDYSWQRLATISDTFGGGKLNNRVDIWVAGLKVFAEHPLLGVGRGAFQWSIIEHMYSAHAAHNTYLSVLVERGVVGFGLFVALALYLISKIRLMPKSARVFWTTLLLTWGVGMISLTWEYKKISWFLLGLLAVQVATFEGVRGPQRVAFKEIRKSLHADIS